MSGKDIYGILRRPIITEKTTLQKEDDNQVVFMVRRDANKIEIREAVEQLFDVEVTAVNTVNYRGKVKRVGRHFGKRPNWKKAIVTLAPGQEVEFFEGLDELEVPEAAAE
jgi:large subunit ribosomal protein L23